MVSFSIIGGSKHNSNAIVNIPEMPKMFNTLFDEAAEAFKKYIADDLVEEMLKNRKSLIEDDDIDTIRAELRLMFRVHCYDWKSVNQKSIRTSVESFVTNAHALCCNNPIKKLTERLKIIHPLPSYEPSSGVINALRSANTITTLNAENIHKVLEILLQMEDLAILQEYIPLIQRNVTLDAVNARRFIFKFNASAKKTNALDILTPNVDEVLVVRQPRFRPFFVKESIETLLSQEISEIEPAIVKRVSKTEVEFAFDYNPMNMDNPMTKYDLIFRPSRTPIRYQYRALELLSENSNMRMYLFPQRTSDIKPTHLFAHFDLVNPNIGENPEQLEAVQNIVFTSNPNAPFIIFGPPGTGKTTTIVESILQIRLQHPHSRILVTAGSNAACDTIAERICHYLKNSPRLKTHFDSANAMPLLRIFSKSIQRRLDNIDDELLGRSNSTGDYPSVENIQKYGIVVATLCTVGRLVSGDVNIAPGKYCGYFTHVFIDEAAASTETETLVGIMGIKNTAHSGCRIILAGDHKQLGPVLKSELAIRLGLAQSMMERLLKNDCYALNSDRNYDRTLQARLRRNYRSHPAIVGLYNHLYYNNELLAMCEDAKADLHRQWSIMPNPKFPIGFQPVYGTTSKQGTTSSCNVLEIDAVTYYLNLLIEIDGVKQTEIGIISPYKLQCNLLQKRLKDLQLNDIEVGSVENFQGREKEVIIVSMVRSHTNLGFLRNERRLNVILSRPKSLLLIIGNPITLNDFKDLRFIIDECKKNGTFLCRKFKNNQHISSVKVEAKVEINTNNLPSLNSNVSGKSRKRRVNKKTPKDNINSDNASTKSPGHNKRHSLQHPKNLENDSDPSKIIATTKSPEHSKRHSLQHPKNLENDSDPSKMNASTKSRRHSKRYSLQNPKDKENYSDLSKMNGSTKSPRHSKHHSLENPKNKENDSNSSKMNTSNDDSNVDKIVEQIFQLRF